MNSTWIDRKTPGVEGIVAGIAFVLLCVAPLGAQVHDPVIDGIIGHVNIDTLISFVRILSGEDSVRIGDSTVVIERRSDFTGRHLAAEYIKAKLESYGLDARDQFFSTDGRNVYGVQTGSLYPDQEYIICAHYDAVTYHCADDNASGVAGVLEAARILAPLDLNYTLIYAVWDKEELGLVGSHFYVDQALTYGEDIRGVVNMDMISWDSTGDGVCDIHGSSAGNSMPLAMLMAGIDSVYGLPLVPSVYNPGSRSSDQASFWDGGYAAVLLIEALRGGDFNPYYHSTYDRVDRINQWYYVNMARLAIGTVATLATADPLVSVDEPRPAVPLSYGIRNFPNPFNSSTVLTYDLPEDGSVSIALFNSAGERVRVVRERFQRAGSYRIVMDGRDLSSGVYLIKLLSPAGMAVNKIVLLK